MRLVCISDTHYYPVDQKLPDGDILVHAGDLTLNGTFRQVSEAGAWLAAQPHKYKVVIAGNHDFLFERKPADALHALGAGQHGIYYLENSSTILGGVKFYGSPWSLRFFDWAFQLDSHNAQREWARVPDDTDVLITHGPPLGILDSVLSSVPGRTKDRLGCGELLKRVEVVKPLVHVFGHIHSSHGQRVVGETTFVNAATCDEAYDHVQEPIVVDI